MFSVREKEILFSALQTYVLEEHLFSGQDFYSIHYGHVYRFYLEDLAFTISLDGPTNLVWPFLFSCSPSNKTSLGLLKGATESGVGVVYSNRSEKVHHLKGKYYVTNRAQQQRNFIHSIYPNCKVLSDAGPLSQRD